MSVCNHSSSVRFFYSFFTVCFFIQRRKELILSGSGWSSSFFLPFRRNQIRYCKQGKQNLGLRRSGGLKPADLFSFGLPEHSLIPQNLKRKIAFLQWLKSCLPDHLIRIPVQVTSFAYHFPGRIDYILHFSLPGSVRPDMLQNN